MLLKKKISRRNEGHHDNHRGSSELDSYFGHKIVEEI
jgi:hypothetical protein